MTGRRDSTLLVVPALQVAADIVGGLSAFLFAYWLRFGTPLRDLLGVELGIPDVGAYALAALAAAAIRLPVFRWAGLYGAARRRSQGAEAVAVARAVTVGMLLATSLAFFYRAFSFSRSVWVLAWGCSVVLIGLGRAAVLSLEWRLRRKGKAALRAAVVGSSPWGQAVCSRVLADPRLGLRLVGSIGVEPGISGLVPVLGTFEDCAELVGSLSIDVLFLAPASAEYPHMDALMAGCAGLDVEMYLVPDALQLASRRVAIERLGGVPALKLRNVRLKGWGAVAKRWFDLVFSACLLIVLSPVLILIAAAVKIDSRGPILYRQRRVGMDRRRFTIVKFRTMRRDAEGATGPVWAARRDPRATPVGRVLRRFGLDELPQLANVLRGEMSLVGPRPERPPFVRLFSEEVPAYAERLRVRSGMTGLAQVRGFRGDTPVAGRIPHDIAYIENWSMGLDLWILLMTPWAVLRGGRGPASGR